ncbi:PBP1A family penicillin-binding protein [Desulfobotulus sp.]|jgi:penicillin-binding protein 1A|uniref:penicillin-binding protein 1A n=1 Tax=Desulfobotulus sp. TaxID=1940337 RepID=UPI002A368980|nr:PBP1A family penicillin-binding protein [Desulfobotulus sp.]MDY0164374.1 PBP1A family penicillin-binding protein [Desulfobotulus sp.]
MKRALLIFAVLGLFGGMVLGFSIGLMRDLPQIAQLEGYRPAAITRILSRDGVLLAEFYAEHRKPIRASEIPDLLKKALIATEDRSFYSHHGVDPKGILRAIVKNLRTGSYAEGASTLTQQLAKTLFLTPEKNISRKIREAFLSLQIERRYTKEEILTLYLNQIYLGSGAYGVEAASLRYFGKSARDLSLTEAALIAGLPKAPSRYSPRSSPERAKERRDTVLRQMHATGNLSREALDQALAEPLNLVSAPPLSIRQAPWFLEAVRMELEEILGPDRLYQEGLTVRTTLDSRIQTLAEAAVARHMPELEARIQKQGQKAFPQCAVFALDVHTGAVLAHIGGRSFNQSPFDRALQAKRQPGSAFKPIIFALAIEKGMEQDQLTSDTPVIFRQSHGRIWSPRNFSRNFLGEISLRKALALSRNIPPIRLTEEMGAEAVVHFAHALGFQSPLAPNLSLALGTSEVSLGELTQAYAVFPAGGIRHLPWRIERVEDAGGALLHTSPRASKAVMSPEAAAIMTDMLQAVIQEGTGRTAASPDRALAGKTGTTDSFRDGLFVGFSPTMVLGVWTGCDDNTPLGPMETGARTALPIWKEIMHQAGPASRPEYFPLPPGTEKRTLDTGEMALFRKNP